MATDKRPKWKTENLKSLARDVRKREREKVRQLRERLKHAKGLARQRGKFTRALCRAERERARARAKAQREALRGAAKLACAQVTLAQRANSHKACEAAKLHATASTEDSVNRAGKHLLAELAYQRELHAYAKRPKARTSTKQERHRESDDEVRGNISHELWPVFDKYRARFKDSPRKSRTEAFTEWASEHPALVNEVLLADVDRAVAELVRGEAKARARMLAPAHHGHSKAKLDKRHAESALLSEVPF